ncbi:hypothetical protein QL285_071466 [Trifolium repens]|nr:hypothetical protein QL285_071466 [Trifolium repens]
MLVLTTRTRSTLIQNKCQSVGRLEFFVNMGAVWNFIAYHKTVEYVADASQSTRHFKSRLQGNLNFVPSGYKTKFLPVR